MAAEIATSMLQQNAMAQQAAQYALTKAHIAPLLHAHQTEAQKMVIPVQSRPYHHTDMKKVLKKTFPPPVTPGPTTPLEQRMNVELANAEGAAVAHARSGEDMNTLAGRLIDHTTSAASGVLQNI